MDMDREQALTEEPTTSSSEVVTEVADAAAEEAAEGIAEEVAAEVVAQLRDEVETLTDRHLRLAAEFDNYRRRVERERAEFRVRVQAELVTPLLDLLDDLQRVSELDSGRTTVEAILEGVQLIEKKFRHVLATEGLEPIDAEGEFFNPSTMEALMTVPAETPEEDDMVADVFQRGYRFKDLLIRPARVRVKKYES